MLFHIRDPGIKMFPQNNADQASTVNGVSSEGTI